MEPVYFQAKVFTPEKNNVTIVLGDKMVIYKTNSRAKTVALGEKIGQQLQGGRVIAFFGGLGMGKTTFVSGIAKGMRLDCHVSSPTFAIVNVYGEHSELCHFDMYRVQSWEDLYSTGYFDYLDMGSVLCVEWSENIENALPADAVRIQISRGGSDEERIIEIDGEL